MDEAGGDLDEVEARLYLIGPGAPQATGTPQNVSVVEKLTVVLDAIEPVGFLLPSSMGHDRSAAQTLRDLCASRGAAFVVQDDPELAEGLGADGVHQSDPKTVAGLRRALVKDQILGADAGRSRHDAMVAGEDGADYVAFGRLGEPVDQEVIDLVSWWREIAVLPSLAFAETPDDVTKLANAGADFVGVSSTVWHHPDGPDAGAQQMQALLEKNQGRSGLGD